MCADLTITNALIVTCDADHSVLPEAAIRVKHGKIDWIGPASQVTGEALDAGGKILMPGLINMHAHCGDSLFRGLVENLPLEEWLQNVWKAQAVILRPAEHCYLGAKLGMAELLLGGTTSVMDMYWHAGETIRAAKEIGMRIATGGIFFDPPGMDGLAAGDRVVQAQQVFDAYQNDAQVFPCTMPHGTYTVGPENLKLAIDQAKDNKGLFCTHAAETKVEQATIQDRYGTSVIRHLNALGGLHERVVLAHCVHLDEVEIDLLATTGTHVAHNPLSNLKLASGFAPVARMLDAGINVTLGTDGAISGNDIDMFLAMRLAATIHKAAGEDPAAITSQQALHMATLSGAKALGAGDRLGSIEVGKDADMVLLDTSRPHAVPMFDPITHLVFSASKSDVTDVFMGGEQVVKSRELTRINLADMLSEVRALAPQIRATLEA